MFGSWDFGFGFWDLLMSSSEPPFTSIAIVGLGLIGGSIALGVRERWPSSRVVGLDTAAVVAHALGSGAIDRAVDSIAALPDASLIVLAAPVRQNIDLLQQLARQNATVRRVRSDPPGRQIIVTDVGGTKRDIVKAARDLPPSATFVGGHPLGGGERGVFAYARPVMFSGRPWIFTPDVDGSSDAVERLSRLVGGLGARPLIVGAEEHDRLMAFLSHLPQLTASALMDTAGSAAGSEGLRMAGRGLVDTTRLASSPADVWRDICLTNADAIGDALDCLIQRLTQMRADLQRGEAIEAIFIAAAKWRSELLKEPDKSQTPSPKTQIKTS
jgi:prephenate dehydrogenase